MATDMTCTAVDTHFASESNRFGVDVHLQLRERDIWYALMPKSAFPLGMGTTIRELTMDRIYVGSDETDWTDVAVSDGSTTSNGCVVTASDLEFGHTIRNWNLQTKAYRTPCICLDDLKTAYAANRQISQTVEALTQATATIFGNRARAEYARLVPKISARPGFGTNGLAGITTTTSMLPNTVLPPTSILTQSHLDRIYTYLGREGSYMNPVSRDGGAAALGLITSGDTSNNIIFSSGIREDFRDANPGELLRPLGVRRVYKGYVHIIDPELPRFNFTDNQWVRVLPYTSEAASDGTRGVPNPSYETAEYELNYIFSPDAMDVAVQQVGPSIPGADFEDHPYYYTGQFFWLNIKHELYNPLGKVGRWLAIFQNGSRPKLPNRGRVIVVKRCPYDVTNTACNYTA